MSFNKKTQKQRIIYTKQYTNRHKKTLKASLLIRGPGIRVPSSAPKSNEESQDSSWDFPFSGALHTFAHFLHTGGKAVFFLALSAFYALWRNLSGQSPSILLAQDRSVA
ncbi:MAG: hypothetical protein ACLT4L_05620 [Faecalibacterium prausnitzii]